MQNLISIPGLRNLLERLHGLCHIPLAIVAPSGDILVNAGWQRVEPEEYTTVQTFDLKYGKLLVRSHKDFCEAELPISEGQTSYGTLCLGKFKPSEVASEGHLLQLATLAVTTILELIRTAKSEERLKESEERLRTLMNSMPDIVCFKDGEGRWLEANLFDINLFELQNIDYRGKKDSDLANESPGFRDSFLTCEDTDEEAWKKGAPQRSDERIQRPDGSILTFDVIKVPTFFPDGRRKGLVVVGRDITAKKEVEKEKEAILKQIQESAEDARQVNKAKDAFLATLSHELRTPLTTILTWAELLPKFSDDRSKIMRAAEMIQQSVRNQSNLINDLLDASRIMSKKLQLDIKDITADTPIQQAIEEIRPMAYEKNIRIQIITDTRSPRLAADPSRLRQIVYNLLSNAVKFSAVGGVVEIKTRQNETHLEITVTDQGLGIAPEYLPKLFERFSQADPSITRKKGGLGLGLAITKGLVELHGGKIRAESAGPNKGTTFAMELPLFDFSPHKDEATRPAEKVTTLPMEKLRRLKVLVVDDEQPTCEALLEMLKTMGMRPAAVNSAAEARTAFTDFRPDLLLIDIAMPGEDGYSLLRSIRQLPATKVAKTPAIAITAFTATEDAHRAAEAGFQGHLGKPIEAASLAAMLLKVSGESLQKQERKSA